jgi:hypothetical protein
MTKKTNSSALYLLSTVNPSPNVLLMNFRRADNQGTHVRRYHFLTLCVCWSCLILLVDGSSPSSGFSEKGGGLEGVAVASQFVSAAPLIVAAVCRDGVAVVAAHTSTEDEPLLYHSTLQDHTTNINTIDESENKDSDLIDEHSVQARGNVNVKDLPLDYGGPFRIHPIDSFGTTLVGAGWRADCEILASRCRSIAASQLASMGPPAQGSLYGRLVSTDLSMYMSQCAVSERVSLSILHFDLRLPNLLYTWLP